MIPSLLVVALPLFLAAFAGVAEATAWWVCICTEYSCCPKHPNDSNATSPCPLSAPCCSMSIRAAYLILAVNLYLGEFGFCGTGAVCAWRGMVRTGIHVPLVLFRWLQPIRLQYTRLVQARTALQRFNGTQNGAQTSSNLLTKMSHSSPSRTNPAFSPIILCLMGTPPNTVRLKSCPYPIAQLTPAFCSLVWQIGSLTRDPSRTATGILRWSSPRPTAARVCPLHDMSTTGRSPPRVCSSLNLNRRSPVFIFSVQSKLAAGEGLSPPSLR